MTRLREIRDSRGWTKRDLLRELRRVATARGYRLVGDASLSRQIARWENSGEPLGELYTELFMLVYECSEIELGVVEGLPNEPDAPEVGDALHDRLAAASAVDGSVVDLLEAQTQNLRLLDRRLGAELLIDQSRAHVGQIEQLMRYAIAGPHREKLAQALTEAAALAGWQAIDLGRLDDAWNYHETARTAARDANDPIVLAHVTAQQAYVLLDAGRHSDGLALMRHARTDEHRLPALLRSWLLAAEAEALAGCAQEAECRRLLDQAYRLLPNSTSADLPFLALDETHLARWRGNCLARLGSGEAVDELTSALGRLDGSFTRARASLLVDLALALAVRGEIEESQHIAQQAAALATRTGSARQRRRIAQLLRLA